MLDLWPLFKRAFTAVDRAVGTDLADGLSLGRAVAMAVGFNFRSRLWILVAAVLLSTHRWKTPLPLRIRGPVGLTTFWVPDYAGMQVLREVFVYREYDASLPRTPRCILDLGSHVGASIVEFACRFPGVPIIGVEPSPVLFPLLERNMRDIPNVTLHNGAVTADRSPVTFSPAATSWAGSTVAGDAGSDGSVTVQGLLFDDLVDRYQADVVKMDIEGAEFDVLPGSRRLDDMLAVLGEIHAKPGTAVAKSVLSVFPDAFDVVSTPDDEHWQPYTLFAAVRR